MALDAQLKIEEDGVVRNLTVADLEGGSTLGYQSGVAPTTVTPPAGSQLRRVYVDAGSTDATVVIGGGNTITVKAGGSFDEKIPGLPGALSVVVGGGVVSFYVAWST